MEYSEYQRASQAYSSFGYHEGGERPYTPEHLTCAALGLAGEAGEVADYIKKCLFHKHPLDGAKLAKELGDVAWYVAMACTATHIQMNELADLGGIARASDHLDRVTLRMFSLVGRVVHQLTDAAARGGDVDRAALRQQLAWVLADVHSMALSIGLDMDTVIAMNLSKLKARYPEGVFIPARSLQRAPGDV